MCALIIKPPSTIDTMAQTVKKWKFLRDMNLLLDGNSEIWNWNWKKLINMPGLKCGQENTIIWSVQGNPLDKLFTICKSYLRHTSYIIQTFNFERYWQQMDNSVLRWMKGCVKKNLHCIFQQFSHSPTFPCEIFGESIPIY